MNHLKEKYEIVIGLEIHTQLLTSSKAFAGDPAAFGSPANTHLSVITIAHPGALPKSNRKMFDYAIKIGLACESQITRLNIFARKNYFYPDSPKGYQITQDKNPICVGGKVNIRMKDGSLKTIPIHRIHLEEDAGKSIHLAEEKDTLIDLNRSGVPLLEIVSEPALHSAEEAYIYLMEVKKIVQYLEICDGNMEEGSLRCDVNISVRLKGESKLGTRVEIKNLNSFRNVVRSIEYEAERQMQLLEGGKKEEIVQETRHFDADTGLTQSMRTKENLNDYRYFPEPDLCPILITEEQLEKIKAEMPVLPNTLYLKFTQEYGLSHYDADVLTVEKETALYFEEIVRKHPNYKSAANWMNGNIKNFLNENKFSILDFKPKPNQISALIQMIDENQLSNTLASQKVFPMLCENPEKDVLLIAKENNWLQESDAGQIQTLIDEVIALYPDKVKEYQKGKKGILGMLIGEVMKKSKGKADPKIANQLMINTLAHLQKI